MKLTALLLSCTLMVGCAKTVTAPVPNQLNTYDAYAFRVLFDAQAAINSFKGSQSASNASVKPILNQAISDYDIAEGAYQAWRSAGGTGSTTAITAAIGKVQADIDGIALATSGGK